MPRPRVKVGKAEVAFVVAIVGLAVFTAAAVIKDQRADPTLVGAFIAMLGLPVFLTADRRNRKDD